MLSKLLESSTCYRLRRVLRQYGDRVALSKRLDHYSLTVSEDDNCLALYDYNFKPCMVAELKRSHFSNNASHAS